ncbi:MAG: protein kinase [Mariniblastus sp.]
MPNERDGGPSSDDSISNESLNALYEKIINQKDDNGALDPDVIGARQVLAIIEQIRDIEKGDTARANETRRNEENFKEYINDDSESWPSKIGRFELQEPIGRGGFGVVFLAHDPNLGRDIALKIPRPEVVTTPELKSRFVREGRASAALSHPNIVPVFESGQVGSICYLASQFVDGETLEQWQSNQETIALAPAAKIVSTLAEAISHAHQRGILHRDIKPANVMLAQNDENDVSGKVRIMDFGLAKVIGESSEFSRTNAIVGTPAYMSPEQANQKDATEASDIYSLGAILFQLLTGKPPLLKESFLETISAVANEDAVPPSKFRNDIPKDLDAITLKCLEKDPRKRYRSAFDLHRDLNAWLGGKPVVARRPSLPERCNRWIKSNRVLAVSMATVFAILTCATIVSGYFAYRSNIDQRSATVANGIAKDKTKIAIKQTDRVSEAVQRLFVSLAREPSLQKAEFAELRERLYVSASEFVKELHVEQEDDPHLQDRYFKLLVWAAQVYSELGRSSAGLATLKEAEALIEKMAESNVNNDQSAYQLNIVRSIRARVLLDAGHADEALAESLIALDFAEQQYYLNLEDDVKAGVLFKELDYACGLALKAGDFANHKSLTDRFENALTAIHKSDPLDWPVDRHCAACLTQIANVALNVGNDASAESLVNKALGIWRELGAKEESTIHAGCGASSATSSQMATVLQRLAVAKSNQGKLEKAEELFQAYQKMISHPDLQHDLSNLKALVASHYDLALVAFRQSKYQDCIDRCKQCIDGSKQIALKAPESDAAYEALKAQHILHVAYCRLGKLEDGERELLLAVEKGEALLNRDPSNERFQAELGSIFCNAGYFYIKERKDPARALELADKAVASAEASYQKGKFTLAYNRYCVALMNRAMAGRNNGDAISEVEYLERFLKIGQQDDRYQKIRQTMMRAYCSAFQFDKAIEQMEVLLNEDSVAHQRFDIAKAIAQALSELDNEEVKAKHDVEKFINEMSKAAIELLNDLKAENYQRGGKAIEELLKENSFNPLRELPEFPGNS